MTLSMILAEDAATTTGGIQPMNFILFALFAVVIVMMFRKQKKAKAAAEEKKAQLVPGVDVMTNFGLFGHVVAVDADNNKMSLEVAPGVVVDVHSQTLAKIIEPEVVTDTVVPDDASSLTLNLDKAEAPAEAPAETVEDAPARSTTESTKDH